MGFHSALELYHQTMTKANCCNLPLKPTEEGDEEEEEEEATVRAAAKEISVDAASSGILIRTGRHFCIKSRTKNATEGFPT